MQGVFDCVHSGSVERGELSRRDAVICMRLFVVGQESVDVASKIVGFADCVCVCMCLVAGFAGGQFG